MAERTHLGTHIIYSFFIAAIVYPLAASWVWGGGWLSVLKYHDYAGSSVIHMIGGFAGLI